MNYYDLVISLVPIPIVSAGIVAQLTSIDITLTLLVGGILSVSIIGHGLFARPPLDDISPTPNSTRVKQSTTKPDSA